MKYLFGDTDIAAKRLKVLADAYAESSKAFLMDAVTDGARLAMDLGCGPGHVTHLIASALPFERVVGLDNSAHFIDLAKESETERVSFSLHDVTLVPFPVEPCDLLYARFLLTHLRELKVIVERWATQLRPRGLLLLEDTEWIHTENAVFARYLEIVGAMLGHQSNNLYVGPLLDSLQVSDKLVKRTNGVRQVPISNDRAATMFYLNLQNWKHQPFIRASYSAEAITWLESSLAELVERSTSDSEITWGIRQLALERTGC